MSTYSFALMVRLPGLQGVHVAYSQDQYASTVRVLSSAGTNFSGLANKKNCQHLYPLTIFIRFLNSLMLVQIVQIVQIC